MKGDNTLEAGIPESFNVLVKEMQSLGLDVRVGYSNPAEAPQTATSALARWPEPVDPTVTENQNRMISSRETARELLGLEKVNQVDHVAIQVASPEMIRSWSKGEVKNPRPSITAPSSPRRADRSANGSLVRSRTGNAPAANTSGSSIAELFVIAAVSKSLLPVFVASGWVTSNLPVPVSHIWFFAHAVAHRTDAGHDGPQFGAGDLL